MAKSKNARKHSKKISSKGAYEILDRLEITVVTANFRGAAKRDPPRLLAVGRDK